MNFKNFGEAIKAGIGYVTEDRKVLGLALTQSVADNVLSCVIDKYSMEFCTPTNGRMTWWMKRSTT